MSLGHMPSRSGLTVPGARRAASPAPTYQQPIGHAHFWQRAMSRGAFIKTAASGTGVLLGASLGLPTIAEAKARPVVAPKPIPAVEDFGTGTFFHVRAPGVFHAADDEPSTITDFNGVVGIAFIQGTGKNTITNEALLFDVDMRFMEGLYVAVDGHQHRGTFGFI